jgi:capsular polysaccharide transport system permease protein
MQPKTPQAEQPTPMPQTKAAPKAPTALKVAASSPPPKKLVAKTESLPRAIEDEDEDDEEAERSLFPAPALPGRSPNEGFQTLRPTKRRKWGTLLSFALCVVAPGALALWYWFAVAADRFVTEAGFVVRVVEDQTAPDVMGGLTGLMGPTSTTSDTAIVLAFLESRDLVELVNQDVDLAQVWSIAEDPLYAYQGGTIEDLVDHWASNVVATHDTTTGLVGITIDAFDPDHSQAIAASVLTHTEDLVNRLSERARQDAMAASQDELARTQDKLRAATEAQRTFRDEAGALNPMGSAEAMVAQIAAVEGELAQVRRQIAQLESRIDPNSPQLQNLRVDEAGLLGQIESMRGQAGGDAELMARFESLELEKQFAQQAYAGALSAVEQARVRAERAQRYLAVYQEPQLAQRATLPNRPLAAALTLLALFTVWSICALLVRHVRDKMV